MLDRFVFRQVYTPDIRLFASDGELRAKNHESPQACHQTSYRELVERRGTEEFQMPCGGVANDYVPFYFSPFTAFCYTIFQQNVDLRSPKGDLLGKASQADRSFIVYKASDLIKDASLQTYFSNTALNNRSIEIEFGVSMDDLSSVVRWSLFDESPIAGHIPEIGYGGCCRYFLDRAEPEAHQDRKARRMAEFLVRNAVSIDCAVCVVTPDDEKKSSVENMLHSEERTIPVFCKPGCFF